MWVYIFKGPAAEIESKLATTASFKSFCRIEIEIKTISVGKGGRKGMTLSAPGYLTEHFTTSEPFEESAGRRSSVCTEKSIDRFQGSHMVKCSVGLCYLPAQIMFETR